MKLLVEENCKEGLEGLMGQRPTFFCCRYIYTGDLVGVNTKTIKLSKAIREDVKPCGIVYETGSLDSKDWSDFQAMPGDWYVQIASIESFGILKG